MVGGVPYRLGGTTTSLVYTRSLSGELSALPELAATLKATGVGSFGAVHRTVQLDPSGEGAGDPSRL
jgi:hypothetical protein